VDTFTFAQFFLPDALLPLLEMIFKSKLLPLLVLSLGTSCVGHYGHDKDQMPLDYVRFPYEAAYPGDDSGQSVLSSVLGRACGQFLTIAFVPVTAEAVFSGITTFAKLPWVQCLTKEKHVPFDIAFLGAPFVS
jgi:agmatinase